MQDTLPVKKSELVVVWVRNPELVAVYCPCHKSEFHVRNRELVAIYGSSQKSGGGGPELVVVRMSGQISGGVCSIRAKRRSLKHAF